MTSLVLKLARRPCYRRLGARAAPNELGSAYRENIVESPLRETVMH